MLKFNLVFVANGEAVIHQFERSKQFLKRGRELESAYDYDKPFQVNNDNMLFVAYMMSKHFKTQLVNDDMCVYVSLTPGANKLNFKKMLTTADEFPTGLPTLEFIQNYCGVPVQSLEIVDHKLLPNRVNDKIKKLRVMPAQKITKQFSYAAITRNPRYYSAEPVLRCFNNPRWLNGLPRRGHFDIEFVQLPNTMTKQEAARYLIQINFAAGRQDIAQCINYAAV